MGLKKRLLLLGALSCLSLSILTGCSQMKALNVGQTQAGGSEGSVVDAVASHLKEVTPSELLTSAQNNIDNTSYVKFQVAYKFRYLDRSVSNQVKQESTDCTIRKYPNGGSWQAITTDEDGNSEVLRELVYLTDFEKEQVDVSELEEITTPFVAYRSWGEAAEEWERVGVKGVWGQQVIETIDFASLINAKNLTLDKGQQQVDELYVYHIHGTLDKDEMEKFVGGLDDALALESVNRVESLKGAKLDVYFYQDFRPYLFNLSAVDNDDGTKDLTFSEWEISVQYGPENKENRMTMNNEAYVNVLQATRQEKLEESYQLGGVAIEVPVEETEELVLETDSEGNIIEAETEDGSNAA